MENTVWAKARYQYRSDTAENWGNANPILLAGEHGVVIDSDIPHQREKIGDGKTPWNELGWYHGPQGEVGPQGDKGDRGNPGVFIGSGDMPEDCNVQIDPDGDVLNFEDVMPPVDQTYNPDSQNPQSGIAIAEAIGKWETIADITIPGGFSSYSYEITEASYPDMTKIKDFYITMAVPKTNEVISGALQVQARTLVNTPVNIARFETWNHTSFNMKGFLFSKLYGDKRHNQYYGFGANAQQSMVNNSLLNSSDCASFKSINIVLSDATKTLPSGMTIKIVGCKQ